MNKNYFYLAFLAIFLFSFSACNTDRTDIPIPLDCSNTSSIWLMKEELKSNMDYYTIESEKLLRIIKLTSQNFEETSTCKGSIFQTVTFWQDYENIVCRGEALLVNDHLYQIKLSPKYPSDSTALIAAICKKQSVCFNETTAYYRDILEMYRTQDNEQNLVIAWVDRCTYLVAEELKACH